MSVSSVSIASFTESAKFTKAMMAPDNKEWKDACDSEMGTLERMKCWEIVDESTMSPDAELIDLSGFLNLSLTMASMSNTKDEWLQKVICRKGLLTSALFLQQFRRSD